MASARMEWPPAINEEQLKSLTLLATTYALSHGLLYLPPNNNDNNGDQQSPTPTAAIHAPLALFPSPFPRRLFRLAQRLQSVYNVLYARIAMDTAFLDQVMGAEVGVGQVDEFTGKLWQGWKGLRDENHMQSLHLGIFRSDYLLHAPDNAAEPTSLKQVEFNTISSSFGPLAERVSHVHKYLHRSTGYFGSSQHLQTENFVPNGNIASIVDGIASAHKAYGASGARVLFVVQPNERNVFDQRLLEYELLETYSVHVIRQTMDELMTSATLDAKTHTLQIHSSSGNQEISVIYFRATYTPSDFPTEQHYTMRFLLERSLAIKCPSIPLQLAGGKKIQQVLTKPGVLESFLLEEARGPELFTPQDVADIRATWVEMWGLDDPAASLQPPSDPASRDGMQRAYERAEHLVLKPQREGGGNNVYRDSIPSFLDSLPSRERMAWIAMKLIEPPTGLGNYLVRAGGGSVGPVKADVVSELGIYGWALFGRDASAAAAGASAGVSVTEKEAGWLVRTKGRESDEGGVAVGFSVLDSVLLID